MSEIGWSGLKKRHWEALHEAAVHKGRYYPFRTVSMQELAELGLVERHPDYPQKRRAYRITDAGHRALNAKNAEKMAEFRKLQVSAL